jgi:GT2 family glycosyltransferase
MRPAVQPPAPDISILVATHQRAASLRALLASLPADAETIVADNASRVEPPGKSRALNAAWPRARGRWLVFLDDDVVVEPGYLAAVRDFVRRHECAAAQGAVLLPAGAATDPATAAVLDRYPVLPTCQPRDGEPHRELKGANMVIRRDVLQQVGGFDERFGPGALGMCEDVELGHRIRAAGGAILGMPAARVVHEIDRSRLTETHWVACTRMRARSRYVLEQPSLPGRILPDLFFAWALAPFAFTVRRRYYYKARRIFYGEMLRLALTGFRAPPASPPR